MMTVDAATFRKIMGFFATGVTVVTTTGAAEIPVGVTVSAFSSLSLDPPLVLFCLDQKTTNLDAYRNSGHFAVHILGEDQREMSVRFARRGDDKWAGQSYEVGETGSPLLPGCLASLECVTTAIHEAGDHLIFIGLVRRAVHGGANKPLLYFRGEYAGLTRPVDAS